MPPKRRRTDPPAEAKQSRNRRRVPNQEPAEKEGTSSI